jgi:hypothetical protein
MLITLRGLLLIGIFVVACCSASDDDNEDSVDTAALGAFPFPSALLLKSAGSFANAVSNEPNVPIRYCGDALILPVGDAASVREPASACPQEKSLSLLHGWFDRLFGVVTRAPKQNQVRWGTATPAKIYNPHGQQSGFGFEGVRHGTPVPTNGSVFYLGTLMHFNHAVFGWVETVDLVINVSLAHRVVTLKIPLRVHETPNEDTCPYKSDHNVGCADRVWMVAKAVPLPAPLAASSRRSADGVLEGGANDPLVLMLRGAKMHPSQPDALSLSFVSQERRNTYAYLYGAIVPGSQVTALSKTAE